MIETILRGMRTLAKTLLVVFLIICGLAGFILSIDWIWDYNRVLGGIVMVTCIIVVFLITSYLIGLAQNGENIRNE